MPVLRNRLAVTRAGGPRQFAELRDRFLVSATDEQAAREARSDLDRLGLNTTQLRNADVLVAEPQDRIESVLERVRNAGMDSVKFRQGISDVEDARDAGEEIIEATTATVSATRALLQEIRGIGGVSIVDFVFTQADYGPENLRFTPGELPNVDPSVAAEQNGSMEQLNRELGLTEAWEDTRGSNATVAIFDTGFAEDLIAPGRVIGTFHDESVSSVFAPAEGHGTMTAGAAAANKEEGVPFNGAAPDADVILVRITDDKGQIRGDIISKAWDWLADRARNRPIVANHSYGTPLCSGRPRTRFCNTALNDVIDAVNEDPMITSVYAAGNEAMQCGHRPSGVTSAVTGTNSLASVITVGALRFDGRDAQRYSSHGRGDCAPISDPKPNVSARLPSKTYYGGEDGWEIKDMSIGVGGSSGGTSHASPTTAGMIALIQSKAVRDGDGPLETEEIKQLIHEAAEPPRPSQINQFGLVLGQKGYDARFGHGEIQINEALSEVGN